MRLPFFKPSAAVFAGSLALLISAAFAQTPIKQGQVASAPATPEQAIFFETKVRPILEEKCFSCHSGTTKSGGLLLSSRANILKGGDSGAIVDLKSPGKGKFIDYVNYRGDQMPPSGKIAQAQIETLEKWVKMGLPWPANSKGSGVAPKKIVPPPVNAETKKFWSFQPVKRSVPPIVKNKTWAKNPIDLFILKKLESKGLAPNVPASKTALLRRATYDLTGMPPTVEEVKAFLADSSPNAYEKVVDRLLASPQYGVQWGRHWLDLTHFAETNSYERDSPKPNAWRYRDYVINSFNQDKPYDQFTKEQLAGDEMKDRTSEQLIATGYYRLGIWDDEPADRDQALYDDMDDILGTTSQVYLGLTVNCARCHDHKLDPIPQKDYYSLLSFFGGVNRYGDHVQKPIGPKEEQDKYYAATRTHDDKLKTAEETISKIEERVKKGFSPVEKEEFKHPQSHADLVRKRVPTLVSEAEFADYAAKLKERIELRRFQAPRMATAMCVTEDPTPRVTNVLMRGNPHVPGDEVKPAFLSVLSPPIPAIAPAPSGESCGRRTALANWIASKENPLTARVIVNRLWQFHFGRGIVRTPSNFGFQGSKPTHPELLDWLAEEFVSKGWKIKTFHKMLMLSSTYKMSSLANPVALKKDPENDLFWRFDMRRLNAEEVRDSILDVNGTLNLKMDGPGVYPIIPKEVLAGQSRPGDGWGESSLAERSRRSAYVFVKRSLILPIIASFDGPETDFSCPVRFSTTQPTQALGMINSDFINEQAKIFAQLIADKGGATLAGRVEFGLQRALQRTATRQEIDRGVKFIAGLQAKNGLTEADALQKYAIVLLNLNEFIYLD